MTHNSFKDQFEVYSRTIILGNNTHVIMKIIKKERRYIGNVDVGNCEEETGTGGMDLDKSMMDMVLIFSNGL